MESSSKETSKLASLQNQLRKHPVSVLRCTDVKEARSLVEQQQQAGHGLLLCVIEGRIHRPLACARTLKQLAPLAHWVFLDVDDRSELAKQIRSPVNRLGQYCSMLTAQTLAQIEPILTKSLQRYQHRQRLSGINAELGQAKRHELSRLQRFTQSVAFLSHLFETANEALIATAPDGTIVMWNQAAEELFGIDNDTAFKLNVCEIAKDEWRERMPRILNQILNEPSGHMTMEMRCRTNNDALINVEVKLAQINEQQNHLIGLSFFVSDITARKQAQAALEVLNKHLEQLCYSDGLTGIANRRRFDLSLAHTWNEARRHKHPISLVLLDLDYFKNYNDNLGHLAGDDCLRQVAEVLASSTSRSTDVLARYGGEEFILLLPHTRAKQAEELVNRCRQNLANEQIPHPDSQVGPWLTVSAGIATMVPQSDDPTELIDLADKQLYHAKTAGRDRVCTDNRVTG